MTNAADNHWSEETLWAKAILYTRQATEVDRESWLYPFWSALALEFIARTALAHVSPTLLADTSQDAGNLLYALGQAPASPKLKSIGTNEVLARCERVLSQFTKEHRTFCDGFTGRRNEELHSGSTTFAALKVSSWLPRYFDAVKALLEASGHSLVDLYDTEATAAEQMIEALHDEAAKQVGKAISAHRTVWEARTELDRDAAAANAEAVATRDAGHVVKCPACGCKALLAGEAVSQREPVLEGEDVVIRTTMLPTSLNCTACGLRISGHPQLHATELGGTYTATERWDAIEYYADDPEYDPEPDFNE